MGETEMLRATKAFVRLQPGRRQSDILQLLRQASICIVRKLDRADLLVVDAESMGPNLVRQIRSFARRPDRIPVVYSGEEEEHFGLEQSLAHWRGVSRPMRDELARQALALCANRT